MAEQLLRRARQAEVRPDAAAEARVWVALDKRRRMRRLAWPMFIAGAATAVVLVVVLVVLWRAPAPHTIAFVTSGPAPRALGLKEQFYAGPSSAIVEIVGAARLCTTPGTSLRVTEPVREAPELTLDEGTALVHVRPRGSRPAFLVHTPRFSARVVGTVFRLTVAANGDSSIAVARGAVELTPATARGTGRVLVRAGERWPAGSTDSASTAELALLGTAELEGATLADFVAPTAPCAGAPETILACQLARAERRSPLAAEEALYEAGWTALYGVHDTDRALDIWRGLRARFPHGALRPDVDASIVDALVARRRTSDALREIDAYLRSYPDGLRSAEMHFVRASLLEERDGDCRHARPDLDFALGRPSAPWATRARTLRAACDRH